MRYVVRFIIPVLVFAGAVYLLTRRREQGGTTRSQARSRERSDTGPFIAILIVSAIVALGTLYVLDSMWTD